MSDNYVYTVDYNDVGGTLYCNSYPVFTMGADNAGVMMMPLSHLLIGKGNVFRVEITELGNAPSLKFRVFQAKEGEMVGPEDGAEIDLTGELPIEIKEVFDSTDDDLSKLLNGLQPSDVETMKAYSAKIVGIINSGSVKEIGDLFEKQNQEMAKSMVEDMGMTEEECQEGINEMTEEIASNGVKIEDNEINPVPCCDNKLWLLKRTDGKDLLYFEEEGGSSSTELTAGLSADGPCIIM